MLSVQHGVVDCKSILQLVTRNYPTTKAQACQLLALGCNDNYRLQGTRREFALRLYRYQWWPEKDIDEELRLLEHLIKKRLPVCKPLRSKQGARYVNAVCAEGKRQAALFAFIPGRPLAHNFGPRLANLVHLGEITAQIHSASDTIRPSLHRWHMNFDRVLPPFFHNFAEQMPHREKDLHFLHRAAQQMQDAIQSRPESEYDIGICHGDLHLHNVMLQDDGQLVVFDFDWCAHTWRLYDLATIYWSLPRNDKGKAAMNAVLRGYSRYRKLGSKDRKILPWFVVLRQFEFLYFQLSVRRHFGHAWLNDNYYDHHIGVLRNWLRVAQQ